MHASRLLQTGRWIAIIATILWTHDTRAVTLYFQLEPGSTITRYQASSPIGPAEPLTGTFTWELHSIFTWQEGLATEYQYNFLISTLQFQSPSYSMTADLTPVGGQSASALRLLEHSLSFNGAVNATGLGFSDLEFSNYPVFHGTYEGAPSSPARLIHPGVSLAPQGGGNWHARISFTAVQVPEPGILAFFALGVLGLRGRFPRHGWNV